MFQRAREVPGSMTGNGLEQPNETLRTGAGDLPIALESDIFLRKLIRELSGVIEDVIGIEEAEGFVSVVAQRMGEWLDASYRDANGVDELDVQQVAAVLVDLKRRINGGFSIEECSPERIVLVNNACPFGDMVIGRTSLCQMTSSVFGTIAAENLGYARVTIDEAIARGDPGCRVIVHLQPQDEVNDSNTMEYFRSLRP